MHFLDNHARNLLEKVSGNLSMATFFSKSSSM